MPKTLEMRVASGKMRGRALKSPDSEQTHPMGAREKLALFNMVNVEQAVALDAYAGSGALGIEALSRGAREVVFVESQSKIARVIKENLATFDLKMPVFTEKVGSFAKKPEFCRNFDVIMADPPYSKINQDELNLLPKLLKNDGVLVLSSPAEMPELALTGMRISSSHTYARARLTIYRKAS